MLFVITASLTGNNFVLLINPLSWRIFLIISILVINLKRSLKTLSNSCTAALPLLMLNRNRKLEGKLQRFGRSLCSVVFCLFLFLNPHIQKVIAAVSVVVFFLFFSKVHSLLVLVNRL